MNEAELYEHFCGGYLCDQPGVVQIIAGHGGGYFGHYCEDHADILELEMTRFAEQNRARLLARKDDDD